MSHELSADSRAGTPVPGPRGAIPRVSIGVPVYNGAQYVAEALESLLAQDYDDLEIIISDNASTDGTTRICEEYAARDPRVRFYRQECNLGASENHARVVESARGEFFKWMHADDRCAPEYVSRCVAALDAGGPHVVIAHPRADLIDPDGTVTQRLAEDLDLRSPLPWRRIADFTRNSTWRNPGLGMIRTDALRSTGLIRPYYCSDHVLLVELALRGEIHEIPEWLFFRRIAHNSLHERPVLDRGVRSEVAHWFDTRRPRRHVGWKMRIRGATLAAIVRSELDAAERARCAAAYLCVGGIRFVQVRRERIARRLGIVDHRRRTGSDAERAAERVDATTKRAAGAR